MLSDGLKGGIAEQALSVALANFPEVRSLDCKAGLAACVKATLQFSHLEWQGHGLVRDRAAQLTKKVTKRRKGAKNTRVAALMHQCLFQAWQTYQTVVQHEPFYCVDSPLADPLGLTSRLCHACNECWCGDKGATILGVSEFARQNCLGFCKPKTPFAR